MSDEANVVWCVLVILALGLIAVGTFSLNWRLGCVCTGCVLLAIVRAYAALWK